MAVPKRKTSPSRRNMRRAHNRAGTGNYHTCPDTGELKLMHHVSPDGWYRGRQVVKAKVKPETTEAAQA